MATNTSKLPVTVVLPVKNDRIALGQCLKRLGQFSEIVVVDSGSSDGTSEIAEEYGAKLLQFNWDGKFPKKRNWYLLNMTPSQPWVLFLDADELISDEVCHAISLALEDESFDGFWLHYTNYFMGEPLLHGLPQRKLALFRAGKGLYERIEEDNWTSLDMEVHEHPIIEGKIGEIRTPIDHQDFRGISQLLKRHHAYAEWEARRYIKLRKNSALSLQFTTRQRLKYTFLRSWWFPFAYFIFVYFFRFGFLDGKRGFFYAAFKSNYFFTIGLLLREFD